MRRAGGDRVTRAIALVTTLAWAVPALLGRSQFADLQAGFIPLRAFVDAPFLVPFFLTPLTATLAHGGVVHLVFNMLLLVYCGRQVEAVIGGRAFMILYVAGAYAAALAHFAVNSASPIPMIGASGAISAVFALYGLLFGRDEVRKLGPIPAHWVRVAWLAIAWIGLQALMSFATHGTDMAIATAAHVGGFLVGLLLARPLLGMRYRG